MIWLSAVGMASEQGGREEVRDAQMDFLNPTGAADGLFEPYT